MDNNLDYQFYDFNDSSLRSNQIRLQFLNKISDNEFSPYYFPTHNDGLDLANEGDIIREENLNDQFLKNQHHYQNDSNGTQHPKCCSATAVGKIVSKNLNEPIFYNPKYERKTQLQSINCCNHHHNNNQINSTSLTDHLSNHLSSQNLNKFLTDNYSNLDPQSDCTDCDLKFANCNCMKLNKINDQLLLKKDVKTKPPTGKNFNNRNDLRNEIVDTKL